MNTAPNPDRYARMRITCESDRTCCDLCGQAVPEGGTVLVWNAAPVITHDGDCPPAWTPHVIDGDPNAQPTLPLANLTVVHLEDA